MRALINLEEMSLSEVKTMHDVLDDALARLCDRMSAILIQIRETEASRSNRKLLYSLKKSYNTCYQTAARTSEELRDLQATFQVLKNRGSGCLQRTADVA